MRGTKVIISRYRQTCVGHLQAFFQSSSDDKQRTQDDCNDLSGDKGLSMQCKREWDPTVSLFLRQYNFLSSFFLTSYFVFRTIKSNKHALLGTRVSPVNERKVTFLLHSFPLHLTICPSSWPPLTLFSPQEKECVCVRELSEYYFRSLVLNEQNKSRVVEARFSQFLHSKRNPICNEREMMMKSSKRRRVFSLKVNDEEENKSPETWSTLHFRSASLLLFLFQNKPLENLDSFTLHVKSRETNDSCQEMHRFSLLFQIQLTRLVLWYKKTR